MCGLHDARSAFTVSAIRHLIALHARAAAANAAAAAAGHETDF